MYHDLSALKKQSQLQEFSFREFDDGAINLDNVKNIVETNRNLLEQTAQAIDLQPLAKSTSLPIDNNENNKLVDNIVTTPDDVNINNISSSKRFPHFDVSLHSLFKSIATKDR
ncbi:hypothetical protein SJI19_00300 [Acerihabitans sp. TG2]|uniref:hypothetical protein n=1 Tax=Acerihabitans sp. TG2 TaxID=3096008 RepID=UPI002B23850C|nr:hypothetical protein [Acerihabitans sp. TG2]MEA9389009.1 hypothetical protein [Acerihabitans sp. TG2]